MSQAVALQWMSEGLGWCGGLCTWARLPSAEEQLEMPLLLVLVVLLS